MIPRSASAWTSSADRPSSPVSTAPVSAPSAGAGRGPVAPSMASGEPGASSGPTPGWVIGCSSGFLASVPS